MATAIVKELAKVAFCNWTPDNRLTVMLNTDARMYMIRLTEFEILDEEDDYMQTTIIIEDMVGRESYFKDVITYGVNVAAIEELATCAIELLSEIVAEETIKYAEIKGLNAHNTGTAMEVF